MLLARKLKESRNKKAPRLSKEGAGVVVFVKQSNIEKSNHLNPYLCKFKPNPLLLWKRHTKPDLSALSGNPTLENRP